MNNEQLMVVKPVVGLFGISCFLYCDMLNIEKRRARAHARHRTGKKVKARVSTYKNKDIIYIPPQLSEKTPRHRFKEKT